MKAHPIVLLLALLSVAGCQILKPTPKPDPELALDYFNCEQYQVDERIKKSSDAFSWFEKEGDMCRVNWNAEADSLKYVVIHHTALPSQFGERDISYMHYKSIYEPIYANETYAEPFIHGLPIHSGHFVKKNNWIFFTKEVETFSAYHMLIHPNGYVERVLRTIKYINDVPYVHDVAWGAGNWKINTQSIQIVLLGDFSNKAPSVRARRVLKDELWEFKELVPQLEFKAHWETRKNPTICPGPWFTDWAIENLW